MFVDIREFSVRDFDGGVNGGILEVVSNYYCGGIGINFDFNLKGEDQDPDL